MFAFEKSHIYFYKCAGSERTSTVGLQVGKHVSLCFPEKIISVLSVNKSSRSCSLTHSHLLSFSQTSSSGGIMRLLCLMSSTPARPCHLPHRKCRLSFPRFDCFLYFITPWHPQSIGILVLLCHMN